MEETSKKIKKPAVGGVKYNGKVIVKKLKGKRIVQSKTYHNRGMANLFKYLASALVGEWQRNQAPACIQLFHINDTGDANAKPDNFNWDDLTTKPENFSSATVPIIYETTPKLYRSKSDSDSGYSVKYSFRIPYSLISQDIIHFAGLFPNKDPATIVPADVLAYYLFTDGDSWNPIEKEKDSTNQYNLIIEWTMEVSNQV